MEVLCPPQTTRWLVKHLHSKVLGHGQQQGQLQIANLQAQLVTENRFIIFSQESLSIVCFIVVLLFESKAYIIGISKCLSERGGDLDITCLKI